jgi:hypothetical protein
LGVDIWWFRFFLRDWFVGFRHRLFSVFASFLLEFWLFRAGTLVPGLFLFCIGA